MRMWLVDPRAMCRQHLLGEHVECHMLRGSLRKVRSLDGFVKGGLVDSRLLFDRHAQLAGEMVRRGYRHASPLPEDFNSMGAPGDVDLEGARRALATRCAECRAGLERPRWAGSRAG